MIIQKIEAIWGCNQLANDHEPSRACRAPTVKVVFLLSGSLNCVRHLVTAAYDGVATVWCVPCI